MGRGLSQRSNEIISAAQDIVAECQPITVRGVAYKLFTGGLIPDMAVQSTNKVSGLLRRAREDGLIPWSAIVDDGRQPRSAGVFSAPATFADAVNSSFRLDPWTEQDTRVEVWSEKGTVGGVLAPVLDEYAVPFRVFKGFTSATSVMDIVTEALRDTRRPLVAYYVGDWDPSGLFMSEVDLPKRLSEYAAMVDGHRVTPCALIRIALGKDDLARLPANSVEDKRGDPRYRWYLDHGHRTKFWELDAMDPVSLRSRVEAAIKTQIEPVAWRRVEVVEMAQQQSLQAVMDGWAALPIRGLDAE